MSNSPSALEPSTAQREAWWAEVGAFIQTQLKAVPELPAGIPADAFEAALSAKIGLGERGVSLREALAELGPPVPRPGKILGAPVNYLDHAREMNVEHTVAGLGFFLKSPSSVVGPDGRVPLPFPGRRTDQEAELGVVIGAIADHLSLEEALDVVFGYTCLVDVTVRGDEDRSTRKSFDTFTPIGPWIVTPDELDDPGRLRLRGWVNGELRQDATTDAMIYGVADIIAYASSVMTLEAGDVA